jgi:hypothetical protein
MLRKAFKFSLFEGIVIKYGYGLNCLLAILMTQVDKNPNESHILLNRHFLNYHMASQN